MRRLLVVSITICLMMAAAPVASAESAPAPAPSSGDDSRRGDPFLLADPRVWGPVLAETGDFAQAAQAAKDSVRISYNLYPLGDANGDGREDFLLENTTTERTETSYRYESIVRAVSGSDFASLWTVNVPQGSYWYPLGDVDLDGVEEIVVVKTKTTGEARSAGTGPVTAYRSDYTETLSFEVLNGASGKPLFSVECVVPYQYTYARARAPVAAAGFSDFKWSYCFLELVPGGGVDVLSQSLIDQRSAYVSGFVAGASAYVVSENLKIQRYNAAGQRSWEWSFQKDNALAGFVGSDDFTGDGVQDFSFVWFPGSPVYVYGIIGGVAPSIPQDGELAMVDGKTGRTTWTLPMPSDSYNLEAAPARSLRAPGTYDLVVSTFGQVDAPIGGWQTTIRQINGATGAVLSTKVLKDKIAAAVGFGDADGDGREDFVFGQSDIKSAPLEEPEIAETIDISIVKTDLTPIWGPIKIGESQYFDWDYDADLDGDKVQEFLVISYPEDGEYATYMFHSGATGKKLWEYKVTSKVVGFQVIDDIDGTPGDDIALTIFDVPDERLKMTDAPAPSPQPGTVPGKESEELNFADYVGRLEIRRGTDRELVWEKKVHDPKEFTNGTAEYVYAYVNIIPDSNGDESPEVLFNLDSPQFVFLSTGGDFQVMAQERALVFALLISGADGKTLKSFPDAKGQASAHIGKAARLNVARLDSKSGGEASAIGALAALLALAGLVAMRRRE